jgi:RNA polymerase sigma factor (sigma-70 family)
MSNPFTSGPEQDIADENLVREAVEGDKKSLEIIIKHHQHWIYNICLKMTGDHADAADLTQEILIKLITVLGTFQNKSSFRTWLYRIVKNHVLNELKRVEKRKTISFDQVGAVLDNTPSINIVEKDEWWADRRLLVNETKLRCMSGMLLCLDERQRLIYILGELLEVGDSVGSEIMEITEVNFRVMLSRAREHLYNFMNEKCGLENKNNPCRCAKKTKGFIEAGIVDPKSLTFSKGYKRTIEQAAASKQTEMEGLLTERYKRLYRKHPFFKSFDFIKSLRGLLASDPVRTTFNLKPKK